MIAIPAIAEMADREFAREATPLPAASLPGDDWELEDEEDPVPNGDAVVVGSTVDVLKMIVMLELVLLDVDDEELEDEDVVGTPVPLNPEAVP